MKRIAGITMVLAGAGMLFAASAVAGDWCVNCHTMHNSQDGAAIDTSAASGNANLLLNSTCLGCHTGTNNGVALKHFVLDDSADPTATQLAGGNFYWTEQGTGAANDAMAHNLTGLPVNGVDGTLGLTPPGGGAALASFTCAGTTGCHGNRAVADEFLDLDGAHHYNATGQITAAAAAAAAAATEPGQAFRFLGGIAGYEDPNREYAGSVTTALHNEYYGEVRANDSVSSTATISYLCSRCHPNFHNDSGGQALGSGASAFASPWLRHPTDYRMDMTAAGTEYTAYTFSNQAPVARSSVPAASSATVNNAAGTDAIVMCLSCHRAHGSPYADILRWDYSTVAGGGDDCISEVGDGASTCGCFKCHTLKDN